MPEDNRTLLRKAEIAVADFTSSGILRPAQADKFIQLAIKEPVLLQDIAVTPMNAFKEDRDKMRFANRVLRGGTEGTALPNADWAKPSLAMVQLDAQLFKAEVRITDEVLEDQIERGKFQDTVMTELSHAVGRDMEWMSINGDTTSSDLTLQKFDGVLKQITSNTVNAGSNKLARQYLRDMLRTMPDEFANMDLKYYTNRKAVLDYKDEVAQRATPAGDNHLLQRKPGIYNDYDVVPVPEFPVVSSNTQCILGDPSSIMLGIYRKIRIKVDEDISAGVVIIVVTMRFDVKILEETAWVKATAVTGS